MSPADRPPSASSEPGPGSAHPVNAGTTFDPAWLEEPAPPPRAAPPRGAPATEAVELLLALQCIDLTTLAPDDTEQRVRALCERAITPLAPDLVAAHELGAPPHTAAVCVFTPFVSTARAALAGSGVGVCTVSAGFPTGAGTLDERLEQIAGARAAQADEIDVVIRRELANAGAWQALYEEVRAFRLACGPVPMKVILGSGELASSATVARAGLTSLMAGADFIKTSTGKEAVNATLPAGRAMAAAIRAYEARTGYPAGLKPAGGISTPQQARDWLALVEAELGAAWLTPARLRFGASGLLGNLVERLREL